MGLGAATTGDLALAREEMRLSVYDADGDGRCDGSECVVKSVAGGGSEGNTQPIATALARIGITLRMEKEEPSWETWNAAALKPARRFGFTFESGWWPDYANASTFFVPLLYGPSITEATNENLALLGADPADLRRCGATRWTRCRVPTRRSKAVWHSPVRRRPSVGHPWTSI